MSDSSAATPTGPASPQVVAYLTSQLARNPIHQSGDIVSHRAKAFKLAPVQSSPAAAAASASTDQRPKLREALEDLRSRSFTASVDESLASLDKLDLAPFPDLAALADRLRVIMKSRSALPQLSGHPKFDGDFFSCLKKVLVSPPRDVSVLREQVLASFRHRKNRKRGQAMVKLLKSELPELYALESDWLESLLRYSPRQEAVATNSGSASTESSNGYGWAIWLFIPVLVGVIRGCAEEESSSNRYQSPDRNRPTASGNLQRIESAPMPNGAFGDRGAPISPEQLNRAQQRAAEVVREHQDRLRHMRENGITFDSDFDRIESHSSDSDSIFADPYPDTGQPPWPSFSPPTPPSTGRSRYPSP